jgi:hypothetical protein
MGFEFENNVEPFSINVIFQSMGVVIFAGIEAFLKTRGDYIMFNFAIGFLGFFMCGCTLLFEFKHQAEQENEDVGLKKLVMISKSKEM